MSDLDARIRDLVARAAADAPPPPEIDETTAFTLSTSDDRRRPGSRWIAGGVAGLSAAAALVAIVWVASDDLADEPAIPLTPSTVESTLPAAPNPTAPTPTTPGTSVDEVPTPTVPPTDPPTSDLPSPTTTIPGGDTFDATVVRAGPEGVVMVAPPTRVVTEEAMAVAFAVPDGRVFMQRSIDHRDPDADTTILVAEPGSTELIAQPMPSPDLAEAPLRLHDVAEVGDEVVLLIESGPGRCAGFDGCDGTLWTLRADSGRLDPVITQSMWEAGFGQLHLGRNGLIVGEQFVEAGSMPFIAVIPGSDAAPIDVTALGLDEHYFDCSTCPTAFSLDASGTMIAWLERDTDEQGVVVQATIVLANSDGTAIERHPVSDQAGEPVVELATAPWLELVGSTVGPAGGVRLFANPGPLAAELATAPLSIDFADGNAIVTDPGFAPGTVVTAG